MAGNEKFRCRLWALVVLLGTWLPASAQPHLIVSGKGAAAGSPSATMSVDLGTFGVQWSAATPWMVPTVTGDGRYLVAFVEPGSSPDSQLWLLDRVSGVLSTIPLGAYVPRELRAHPRRFELYALMTDGTVASITMGGVRPIYTCATPGGLDLSGDGQRLALTCFNDLVVLDANAGGLITRFTVHGERLFPPAAQEVRSPVANFDGSRVLVVVRRRNGVGDDEDDLAVYDVATRTRVAFRISPALFGGESVGRAVAVTASRDAVLVNTGWNALLGNYGHRALLVDFSTLVVRKTVPLGGDGFCKRPSSYCPTPISGAFTPDGRYAVMGSWDPYTFPEGRATLQIADVESSMLVASANYFGTAGVSIALASAPLPPADLAAEVAGHNVTVSWSLPPESPAVTGYVLEAGSAPGLANLAVMNVDGDQRSLTVPDVTPGRYHVRVRARNVTGTSAVSNEIVVDVP